MISFSRLAARQARVVFRRALGVSTRGPGPPVTLAAEDGRVVLRAVNHVAAVQLCLSQEASLESPLMVPFDLLGDCESARNEQVTLEAIDDGRLRASWSDKGAPQMCLYDSPGTTEAAFPSLPRRMAENGPELLRALRDAVASTEADPGRFSLNCVQLRGGKGEIAATDSRQVLIQSGFNFAWKRDVLAPGNSIFGSAALPAKDPVRIGVAADWLAVEIAPWRIFLAIDKKGRFPRVDDTVRSPDDAEAVVHLAEADAAFLAESLPRLPGRAKPFQPVTIDADREVVVRAADPSQAPTELALCGASHAGKEMRLSTDRKYLARAVELGFRELYLYGPGVPILCRDERRSYLWAVLESEDAIGPNEDAVRNTSPAPGEAPPDSPPSTHGLQEEEQKSTMPRHSNGRSSPPNSAAAKSEAAPEQSGAAESVSVDGLIRQAEEVKNSLRTAATQVSELISGLKRHRKHSRTLQTALSSIRQLQSLDM